MAAITICSDFGAQEKKVCHCFHCFPVYLSWSNGIGCHDPSFLKLSFKPAFALSSFTFIKTFFNFFSCSDIQFTSVTQSCPTFCDPMNHSTPGLPVHHQLLESTQTQVHWVSDDIQPSHPLSSPSPPALSLSQHQGLFQWVNSSHEVAKVLEFLALGWCYLHIWGYWYFSWQSWFQVVIHPAWHFPWCTLHKN